MGLGQDPGELRLGFVGTTHMPFIKRTDCEPMVPTVWVGDPVERGAGEPTRQNESVGNPPGIITELSYL